MSIQTITDLNNKSQKKMITYLMVILTIFIVIVFTKKIYFSIVDSNFQLESINSEIEEKNKELDKITKIKLEASSLKNGEIYNKYLINFNENEILSYFYDYVNRVNRNSSNIKINSISLDKGTKNEVGFMEGNINLSVTFANEQAMLDMLNMLIDNDKYNFFVHSLNYPVENSKQAFTIQLPIKVLYK